MYPLNGAGILQLQVGSPRVIKIGEYGSSRVSQFERMSVSSINTSPTACDATRPIKLA